MKKEIAKARVWLEQDDSHDNVRTFVWWNDQDDVDHMEDLVIELNNELCEAGWRVFGTRCQWKEEKEKKKEALETDKKEVP